MQDFFQDCVMNHISDSSLKKNIQTIFEKHGLGKSMEKLLLTDMMKDLFVIIPQDCVKICISYISFDDENFIEIDVVTDQKILHEMKDKSWNQYCWLYTKAMKIGVCNTLICCTYKPNFEYPEYDFVLMFVLVAKFYGERIFMKTLTYSGVLPIWQAHLYEQIVNQVAEYLFKVRTICLKGSFCCSCFEYNLIIFKEYRDLEVNIYQSTNNINIQANMKDKLQANMRAKYAPFVPIFGKTEK